MDADGAAPAFCSTHADAGVFCADFDDGTLPGPFTGIDQSNGGLPAVDDGDGGSRSLVSTIPQGTGSSSACLKRTFAGSRATITVELDARVEVLGGDNYDFVTLLKDDAHNLSIQVAGGRLEFDENYPVDGGWDQTFTSTSASIDGAWHHYRLSVAIGASVATSQLFVDGTLVGSYDAAPVDFGPPFELQVGDCLIPAASGPWRVRIDNVLLY